MEFILRKIHKAGSLSWLYLANLFVGLHYFTLQFVNSSFFSTYLGTDAVGIVFSLAALLTLLTLMEGPRFFAHIGVYKTARTAALLDLMATAGIVVVSHETLLVLFFVMHTVAMGIILLCLDLYLEQQNQGDTEEIGNVRGLFLTVATLAALGAQLLTGLLASSDPSYRTVYFTSMLFVIPFLAILVAQLRTCTYDPHHAYSFIATIRTLRRNSDIFHSGVAQFLLRFYFSWMTIYLPIHLHLTIGMPWEEIGLVLFIMMIPYLIIEWPAGLIADRWLGEQELLTTGFIVAAGATYALTLITTANIVLWAVVLFVTRIGTALIESMGETHFYKRVRSDDADIISAYHMLKPLADIVGPLCATGILFLTDSINVLWYLLAFIMLIGLTSAARIVDSK